MLTGKLDARPTINAASSTNGVNPFDTCLRVGFPAGAPEPGALWFFTNVNCLSEGNDRIDLAQVVYDQTGYSAIPDSTFTGCLDGTRNRCVNTFTARSGLLACIFEPNRGKVRYRFSSEGTVEGEIDLVGAGCEDEPGNGTSRYSATLQGRRTTADAEEL